MIDFAIQFFTDWWFLWMMFAGLVALAVIGDWLGEDDDIDALIEWERRHE